MLSISAIPSIEVTLIRLFHEVLAMHHEFNHVFLTGNTVVVETKIICTKVNGSEVSISGVIFLKMEEGLINVIKMFMDFAPIS